jgi:hypothetical protein
VPFRISEKPCGTRALKCGECLYLYRQEDEPIHQIAWTVQKLPRFNMFFSSLLDNTALPMPKHVRLPAYPALLPHRHAAFP